LGRIDHFRRAAEYSVSASCPTWGNLVLGTIFKRKAA
jgi:hypothetical protein